MCLHENCFIHENIVNFGMQPDKGSTVPEFGGWEKDPNSADGYTGIFDNLRAEKQDGSARVPIVSNDPYQTNDHKRSSQNTVSQSSAFFIL